MDDAQSELLALLFKEGLFSQPVAAVPRLGSDGSGMVTWQSHDHITQQQQPVPVEGGAVVGCKRERVEPAKELTTNYPNPLSFLNANANTVDTNTDVLGGTFESMLDTILGSSSMEVATGTETPSNSPSLLPSPPPLPTSPPEASCEIAATFSGTAVMDDLFDVELDKLLHPFAESILNPVGGDMDTWDIESMLTAS